MLKEAVKLLPLYVAVALGISTLLGASFSALMNWKISRAQREWERERWTRERREGAYKECLNYLTQSRTVPFEGVGGSLISCEDFEVRIKTLQYVPIWTTVLEAYVSEDSKRQIRSASKALFRCVEKVRAAVQDANSGVVPDNGLTDAIDNMLKVIVDCTKRDLYCNVSPNGHRGFWRKGL